MDIAIGALNHDTKIPLIPTLKNLVGVPLDVLMMK